MNSISNATLSAMFLCVVLVTYVLCTHAEGLVPTSHSCFTSPQHIQGLKNLNSSLPFRKTALKFCLSGADLRTFLFYLVDRQFSGLLPIRQVTINSYLPSRRICLYWKNGQHFSRAQNMLPSVCLP